MSTRFSKRIIQFLLLALLLCGIIIGINYNRLLIITGYAAKSSCSCVFIAGRSAENTAAEDNNFSPVNLARVSVDHNQKLTTASLWGLFKRTAQFREGQGCVLNPVKSFKADFTTPVSPTTWNEPRYFSHYGPVKPQDTFIQWDQKQLNNALDMAFNPEYGKTRAFLVIYRDSLIAERYAPGIDASTRLLGWSMTKSLLATMYGILETKKILDIDDAAPVPLWSSDDRSQLTLRHLLQMNSGLTWEEDYSRVSDVTRMLFGSIDMSIIQQRKEFNVPPGTLFRYSSGTTNLLSNLLKQYLKTQNDYLKAPYDLLANRIGMKSLLIETDISGNFVGSSYGWATARDWARFGLLYLHEGTWQQDTIFSKDWADFVRTPAAGSDQTYGAHFWLNASGNMPEVPRDAYYADGFQGQRLCIIPSRDVVILRLGLDHEEDFEFNKVFAAVLKSLK